MLSNKSFQSMPPFCADLHIRAGQFQDMLGIEEGIKRRKEKRQYTRRIIKFHARRENCRRERALLFSKQETAPDLKKEMINKKRKKQEHNFSKILRKKTLSGVFCLKICN